MRRSWAILLGAVAFSVGAMALDPAGYRHAKTLRQDIRRIQEENATLRKGNERLRQELRRLADDPQALEQAAREELGLMRPDEVIFRLEEEDAPLAP